MSRYNDMKPVSQAKGFTATKYYINCVLRTKRQKIDATSYYCIIRNSKIFPGIFQEISSKKKRKQSQKRHILLLICTLLPIEYAGEDRKQIGYRFNEIANFSSVWIECSGKILRGKIVNSLEFEKLYCMYVYYFQ